MTLAAGAHIGPYEIQSPLGAGGMGEVYRARDTKLGRDVAVKILPDHFLHDPERVARFQREAQLLAALNHPNIAQIYGFEDTSDVRALVMELVEGPTLAERLSQVGRVPRSAEEHVGRVPRSGPAGLPLDEALPIARQMAEALEAAHEQGIIHRDLKPANVKVRPDGTVKVLDFGLAKLNDPNAPNVSNGPNALSQAPTITSPAMMTGAGMILGTAAYMAPEQARGKDVDKRADIWAFGCVLYEMLTGRRAFAANEVSDTLAMVLMKEPDWSRVPAATPPAIRTLLRRCLEKDRKRRLPDIGVARLEIEEALAAPALPTTSTETTAHRGGPRWAWIVAAVAGVTAIGVGALHFTEQSPEAPAPIRFDVSPQAGATFTEFAHQALSPDGRHIVFQVEPTAGGQARLAVRTLDADQPRELPGTEGATTVFWSPDSRFIGFDAGGTLKKVDITGGPPQILCNLPSRAAGGTWSSDGTILIGQNLAGLLRVSSSGGNPVPVTMLDATQKESSHRHPWFLPDGRHFLFVATLGPGGSFSAHSVHVGSLDGEPPTPLMPVDGKAVYAAGFLLFVRDGTLLAQPFNAASRLTTDDPVVVAQDLEARVVTGDAAFSVSATGILSYRTTSAARVTSKLVWLDRSGKVLSTIGEEADQTELHLSPDETRVAVSVLDPTRRTRDIWIHDLTRDGLRTRFTFDAGEDWTSVWSPDGRSVVFSGGRPSPLNLYRKASDASGVEELLVEGTGNKYISSWSADGRFLLYGTGSAGSQTLADLWVLPLTEGQKPRPFLQTPFSEIDGQFSPDGRWVAYESNESGRYEIYVTPFAAARGKWQVSTEGGEWPRWRSDGKELFYVEAKTLMAAEVNGAGASFQVGVVRRLFEVDRRTESYLGFGPGSAYDVAADGQRFLVNVVVDDQVASPPITVITNWTATLR